MKINNNRSEALAPVSSNHGKRLRLLSTGLKKRLGFPTHNYWIGRSVIAQLILNSNMYYIQLQYNRPYTQITFCRDFCLPLHVILLP
jgi:hypothetical protein